MTHISFSSQRTLLLLTLHRYPFCQRTQQKKHLRKIWAIPFSTLQHIRENMKLRNSLRCLVVFYATSMLVGSKALSNKARTLPTCSCVVFTVVSSCTQRWEQPRHPACRRKKAMCAKTQSCLLRAVKSPSIITSGGHLLTDTQPSAAKIQFWDRFYWLICQHNMRTVYSEKCYNNIELLEQIYFYFWLMMFLTEATSLLSAQPVDFSRLHVCCQSANHTRQGHGS